MDEEFKKRTVGGEAEADSGASETIFLELEEVGAKVVWGERPPLGELITEEFTQQAQGKGVVLERFRRGVFLGGHELDEGVELEVSLGGHGETIREI